MDSNQVFTSSGISTRGQDLDEVCSNDNHHNHQIQNINNNDQQSQVNVSRPLTTNSQFTSSNQSFIESFNDIPILPIPNSNNNINNNNNNLLQSSSFLSIFSNSSQLTSSSLHQKFSKLIKLERKKLIKQHDLIKEIQNWCNILTNDDCKKLLYNFIKILELEIETSDYLIKRREFINQQLLNVHKREKRTNELKLKRNKILIKLRENENKVGDSPITTLTKENLEELECSVDIVEDQFIRSINNGLKNSLSEYLIIYQNQIPKNKEICKNFLNNYYINTNENIGSPSLNSSSIGNIGGNISSSNASSNINLQRLIIQKKLNNQGFPPQSREISSSANNSNNNNNNNNPKYIALSPNQIGKFLDNRYIELDDDNNKGNQSSGNGQQQEQQQQQQQQPSTSSSSKPIQVNQPSIINLTDAEIKMKKLNNTIQTSSHYNVQPGNPPPTASTNKDLKEKNVGNNNGNNNDDNDPTGYIINHYSTPGGLGIRPPTSTNHEWT